jgi:hypothetical protein
MIELLLILFAGAFINACLTDFLITCYGDQMIFKRWVPFLERMITDRSFWFKPLGGCGYCHNVWWSFITFPVIIQFFDMWGIGLWYFCFQIAFTVVSAFFFSKMND